MSAKAHQKKRGPAPGITPEIQTELCGLAKAGLGREPCARKVKIHTNTLVRWIRIGEAEDAEEPYRTFALEYLAAEAEHELTLQGQAAAQKPFEVLVRRWPKRWREGANGEEIDDGDRRPLVEEEIRRSERAAHRLYLTRKGVTLPPEDDDA